MTSSPDEARQALAGWRDEQFAVLVVSVVKLAALKHPDLLRDAIAEVFDLSAVTHACESADRQAREALAVAHRVAAEMRDLVHGINLEVEKMERRMDALNLATERAATARAPRIAATA